MHNNKYENDGKKILPERCCWLPLPLQRDNLLLFVYRGEHVFARATEHIYIYIPGWWFFSYFVRSLFIVPVLVHHIVCRNIYYNMPGLDVMAVNVPLFSLANIKSTEPNESRLCALSSVEIDNKTQVFTSFHTSILPFHRRSFISYNCICIFIGQEVVAIFCVSFFPRFCCCCCCCLFNVHFIVWYSALFILYCSACAFSNENIIIIITLGDAHIYTAYASLSYPQSTTAFDSLHCIAHTRGLSGQCVATAATTREEKKRHVDNVSVFNCARVLCTCIFVLSIRWSGSLEALKGKP